MTHTPIPWKVCGPRLDRVASSDSDHYTMFGPIADCNHPDFDAPANAAFIVRAVNSHGDLLAALEKMLTPCPPSTHEIGPDGECPTCPVEEQARAAIEAAKGEIT